ncbi:MAG: response regulator transcription factor [Lachnospiraceae bacterium]|nr:response regulator transcription factor [Lachnospiraceae bacterium]
MGNIYDSTLLLVDDSEELRRLVTEILNREGFVHVDTASCVKEANAYFLQKEPDLLILDINLPDGDGFSLLQKIRTISDVPVLCLSARDEDNDRLLGLGLGADDYMVKPFLPRELILRVCAILKRTNRNAAETAPEQNVLILGARRVDFGSGTVFATEQGLEQEREISLTAKELAILRKLSENRGNIVTFDQLCQAVWQDNYYGYENTIMVHIRRLREKIEEEPSRPEYLLTVRGIGYKLAK